MQKSIQFFLLGLLAVATVVLLGDPASARGIYVSRENAPAGTPQCSLEQVMYGGVKHPGTRRAYTLYSSWPREKSLEGGPR